MERYAWKAKIKKGKVKEYIKRHNEIWPEMVKVLKRAGIKNYSIWTDGDLVFGYYECKKGIDFAVKTQNDSKIVEKWNKFMKNVMDMKFDSKKESQPRLDNIFYLK